MSLELAKVNFTDLWRLCELVNDSCVCWAFC
nr:MAG TPA: hypothetical protein [Caudoviricetes sp.]